MPTIYGRKDELAALSEWVFAPEPTGGDAKRTALLIGTAGIGKSALLRAFAESGVGDSQHPGVAHYAEVNKNESPDAFLDRLIRETHTKLRTRRLRAGPNDQRFLALLTKAIPEACGAKSLGDLLAALVSPEDVRPAWQRFADYLKGVSAALGDKERYVLLVDPIRAMKQEQAEDWLTVAANLSPKVRVIIAQRPDDCVAAHTESWRHCTKIPSEPLTDISEPDVLDWYQAEFAGGRLHPHLPHWSRSDRSVRRNLPRFAYERYRGHPFAHEYVIRSLTAAAPDDAVKHIQDWPSEVAELLNTMMRWIKALGDDQHRAALTLAVFPLATPLQVWSAACDIDALTLNRLLDDPKFRHFFDATDDHHYAPFHALLAERLDRELETTPDTAREIARRCWEAIAPTLAPEKTKRETPADFYIRAAVPVALRCDDPKLFFQALDRTRDLNLRLRRLDAAENDINLALARHGNDEAVRAACLGNLGVIHQARDDLDKAEEMFHKVLEIEQKLGRLDSMANAYGNLGLVHHMRGELDKAEEMFHKVLVIEQKLGRLDSLASAYGNLGLIHHTRGDLDKAEEMLRKSLKIFEKLGRLEGMASDSGNLALIHHTRGDLDKAEEMHRKALDIEEKLGRSEGMASAYGNLGLIYQKRGDLNEARRVWTKARALFEKIGMLHRVKQTQGALDGLPHEDPQ